MDAKLANDLVEFFRSHVLDDEWDQGHLMRWDGDEDSTFEELLLAIETTDTPVYCNWGARNTTVDLYRRLLAASKGQQEERA